MASEIRVNKIENRSGLGTVTFADTGVDLAGIVTATTFSGSGASLTALPAAQLSGALPAISAASLTNVPAANVVGVHTSLTVTNATTTGTAVVGGGVTISESGIEASGIGITCANINGQQIGGRRNIIINGEMKINEHSDSNAGAHNTYAVDRFKLKKESTAANFTMSQSTTSPDGLSRSLKMDCTTADTSTAHNEFVVLRQSIEASDLQQLGYGTAAAKPLVLSFYVRSNVTGVYSLNCVQNDNSSKIYSRTYTIDSADTWERKTISIPADTSGVINDDNGEGLQINFNLLLGSSYKGSAVSTTWETYANDKWGSQHGINLASSTSNEWYLTGVQLEVGSQATAFEHRSYAEELTLCQRYFYRIRPVTDYAAYGVGGAYSNTQAVAQIHFPTPLRASPTFSYNGALNTYYDVVGGFTNFSNMTVSQVMGAPDVTSLKVNVVGNGTSGNTFMLATFGNSTTYLDFDSEL